MIGLLEKVCLNKSKNRNIGILRIPTKLIDKIVILTKAKREDNLHLLEEANSRLDREVKFIFVEELNELLSKIAKSFIGIKENIE